MGGHALYQQQKKKELSFFFLKKNRHYNLFRYKHLVIFILIYIYGRRHLGAQTIKIVFHQYLL